MEYLWEQVGYLSSRNYLIYGCLWREVFLLRKHWLWQFVIDLDMWWRLETSWWGCKILWGWFWSWLHRLFRYLGRGEWHQWRWVLWFRWILLHKWYLLEWQLHNRQPRLDWYQCWSLFRWRNLWQFVWFWGYDWNLQQVRFRQPVFFWGLSLQVQFTWDQESFWKDRYSILQIWLWWVLLWNQDLQGDLQFRF